MNAFWMFMLQTDPQARQHHLWILPAALPAQSELGSCRRILQSNIWTLSSIVEDALVELIYVVSILGCEYWTTLSAYCS
jgi:hypothetical protein